MEDLDGNRVSSSDTITVTAHVVYQQSGFGVTYYVTQEVTQQVTLSGTSTTFNITHTLGNNQYLEEDLC